MALPPAKIKAYLSTIKKIYLDNASTSTALAHAFLGILKIELLLRGLLVEDDKEVWGRIQDSVGKRLLVEQSSTSKIPKALLAGANVMAGRLTEAFHIKLRTLIASKPDRNTDNITSFDFMRDLVPLENSSGARRRAEDLQDERWYFLICHDSYDISIEDYSNGILQVALGYYSTAASIQSDTPQMWKKLWDVWSLFETASSSDGNCVHDCDSGPPFEAQIAIENLIRIATLRNNTKRASELQLRLVQSYLNTMRISLVGNPDPSKKRKDNTVETIAQYFGDSFTQYLSDQDKLKGIVASTQKARLILETCRPYYENEMKVEEREKPYLGIDTERILYRTLDVQTLLAQEDAKAQEDAREKKMRSSTNISLADCAVQSRTSLILSSYQSTDNFFLKHATLLRDTMIVGWRSALSLQNTERQGDGLVEPVEEIKSMNICFQCVERSIFRLKERADIISREKSSYHEPWNELLQYILPILKEIEFQITHTGKSIVDTDKSTSRVASAVQWLGEMGGGKNANIDIDRCASLNVVDTVVSILPNVLWMILGDENKIPTFGKELNLATDVLSALIKWQESSVSQKQQTEAPIVGSKDSMESTRVAQWQQARASTVCFICQDHNPSIQKITSDAISTCKKKQKRGFLAFLQCLVSWSGWFQNPWPYCANLGDARRLIVSAELDLSRPLTSVEGILLQLAKADAEFLNGGFLERAREHYTNVLDNLQDEGLSIDHHTILLLQAHCYNGMARVQYVTQEYTNYDDAESLITRKSLEILENNTFHDLSMTPSLWIWNLRSTFVASKTHQLNVTRQLIANALVQFGRFEEALTFLQKAVDDSPLDADAALAFGAFLFRVTFYIESGRSPERSKEVQVHLLKAAKLDPSKSNPFALLGLWYETTGDLRRAQGCFRKSLKLNSCNPVAGRGLLRILPNSNHEDILDLAINESSPLNGWAWNAVGLNKAYNDGDDDLALVAILKALRCRDVALPNKESLGVFYHTPSFKGVSELSAALAEVGMSYRRLGRLTASIRAFRASVEAAETTSVQSSTLISCAQVEQELGLFDDAAERFGVVIDRGENTSVSVALYGQAKALFSLAERELADGKAVSAFSCIERAIDNCRNSAKVSGCQLKLLGDLYSFGAYFPLDVFSDHESLNRDPDRCLQNQLEFVSKGEDAFRSSLSVQATILTVGDDDIAIKSSILCDIASNILLQAQIHSSRLVSVEKINDRYHSAAEAFRQAIEYNPIHAASWCGLGCSVVKTDVLLAQHAFCRCIEIDNMFPDAYANIGFLYTSKFAFAASKSTMEALTQIADNPMMWVNLAFIFEREAQESLNENMRKSENFIKKAADAYRASLQVTQHPEAQLGLSLTGRVEQRKTQNSDIQCSRLFSQKRKDSLSLLKECISTSFYKIRAAPVFQGVMSIEVGEYVPSHVSWKHDIVAKGKDDAKISNGQEDGIGVPLNDNSMQKLGASVAKLLGGVERKDKSSPLCMKGKNLQRQIWLEPGRGDLWLSLAKLFVEKNSIESARRAASRAATILRQDLLASSRNNVKTVSFVDAKIISEATSLQYWLNAMQTKSISPYTMQRVLVMDPTNVVARYNLLYKKE